MIHNFLVSNEFAYNGLTTYTSNQCTIEVSYDVITITTASTVHSIANSLLQLVAYLSHSKLIQLPINNDSLTYSH